jgi:hypothetical protein
MALLKRVYNKKNVTKSLPGKRDGSSGNGLKT